MPVISRFEGIVIKMYFRTKEHNPPHIHAIYGEYIGVFSLKDGEMFQGDLPIKEQRLVKDFIDFYRDKLLVMWVTQKFEMLPSVE
ncbi:MAG: DUF4160 domain-containing protein [Tyzzerella sp.]|nr:DUF4160 domain-containing protein [Tyzzerella sp.]